MKSKWRRTYPPWWLRQRNPEAAAADRAELAGNPALWPKKAEDFPGSHCKAVREKLTAGPEEAYPEG